MNSNIISLDEIKITGIMARTSNAVAHLDISALWEKFYSENIKEKITSKLSEDIYSLYTEYESDHTSPYTVVIGCKVEDFSNVPSGMVTKIIPASKFAVFNAKGNMPDKIIETWKYIWNADIERTYMGDFELYTEKFFSEEPEANIYVSVK